MTPLTQTTAPCPVTSVPRAFCLPSNPISLRSGALTSLGPSGDNQPLTEDYPGGILMLAGTLQSFSFQLWCLE